MTYHSHRELWIIDRIAEAIVVALIAFVVWSIAAAPIPTPEHPPREETP